MASDIGIGQGLGSRITDGTIKGEDIANNRITGCDVNESTLEIVPLAATANTVADDAITGAKVQNDALTGDDIDESTLTGVSTPDDVDCKGAKGDPGEKATLATPVPERRPERSCTSTSPPAPTAGKR